VGGVFRTGSVYLAADAEYVDWAQLRMRSDVDPVYFDELNLDIRQNLRAVWNTRLGAEFSKGPYVVRAGLAWQPDPWQHAEVDRSRRYVSAGLSYQLSRQFWLDVSWQQEAFNDVYYPYTEVENAPVVYEEVTRHRLTLGLRVLLDR